VSRILIQPDGTIARDGRLLHSKKDPLREALLWVSGRPTNLSSLVFILGLGAAHHVNELHRQNPNLTLVVCDFDPELFTAANLLPVTSFDQCETLAAGLFGFCMTKVTEPRGPGLLDRGYSVLRFRPAWAARETEFNALENALLDRSIENLEPDFLTMPAADWPRGLDVNVKSLTTNGVRATDDENQKLLAALRELVV
jgi:hypothetical protein